MKNNITLSAENIPAEFLNAAPDIITIPLLSHAGGLTPRICSIRLEETFLNNNPLDHFENWRGLLYLKRIMLMSVHKKLLFHNILYKINAKLKKIHSGFWLDGSCTGQINTLYMISLVKTLQLCILISLIYKKIWHHWSEENMNGDKKIGCF